ncbi:hypothetical protein ACOI1C_08075 [Bacillus sp. DJP31]
MTTLAMVGAGVVAYGVTRSMSNRKNGQGMHNEKNDFVTDTPEIFQ